MEHLSSGPKNYTQLNINHQTETSRLLSLPAELRLRIWEFVLCWPSPLGIGGIYPTVRPTTPLIFSPSTTFKQSLGIQPSITLTCHSVRAETLALFYKLNQFILSVHYRRAKIEVHRWLSIISSHPVSIASHMQRVSIEHRFGILDFKGAIDFDLKEFRILGPDLWFNAIPPMIFKEVYAVIETAQQEVVQASVHEGEEDREERAGLLVVRTLSRLIDLLGI